MRSSVQRDAARAAKIVSKGPGEAASMPGPALHPELSASLAGVLASSPAAGRQNSWGEAREGARLMRGHSSSLLCSTFVLLLL